ncbi:MAG: STAS domain-containing protein [Mariprofundaceae bacterium]
MQLDIREEREDDAVSLAIRGEVNIHTSTQLRNHLKPLLTANTRSIHIDLSGVNFMDSAGIATLVEGLQWSRSAGGKFVLVGLTDNVRDVFTLSKLDTVFTIEG